MSDNHEWISKSGRPWSLRVKSDLCAKCGTTPDAHPARSTPAEALDEALLAAAMMEALTPGYRDGPGSAAHKKMHRQRAERIAAEYARLSERRDKEGTE